MINHPLTELTQKVGPFYYNKRVPEQTFDEALPLRFNVAPGAVRLNTEEWHRITADAYFNPKRSFRASFFDLETGNCSPVCILT